MRLFLITFSAFMLFLTAPASAEVVAGKLKIEHRGEEMFGRQGPGPSFPISGKIPVGEVVDELNHDGAWVQIHRENGETHWIFGKYLKAIHSCAFDRANPADARTMGADTDGSPITALAFDPLGQLYFSGSTMGEILIRRKSDGAIIERLSRGRGPIRTLSVSSDGTELLVLQGGGVIAWDIATTCTVKRSYFGGLTANTLLASRYSENEQMVLALSEQSLSAWVRKTGKLDPGQSAYYFEFAGRSTWDEALLSPTGNQLVFFPSVGRKRTFSILDFRTKTILAKFNSDPLDSEDFSTFDFSPKSNLSLFVSKGLWANFFHVLVVGPDGDVLMDYKTKSGVLSAQFTPDENGILVVQEDGALLRIDIGSTAVHELFREEAAPVTSILFQDGGENALIGLRNGGARFVGSSEFAPAGRTGERRFVSYRTPTGQIVNELKRRGAWRLVETGPDHQKEWVLNSFLRPSEEGEITRQTQEDAVGISFSTQVASFELNIRQFVFSAAADFLYVITENPAYGTSGPVLVYSTRKDVLVDVIDLPVELGNFRASIDGENLLIFGSANYEGEGSRDTRIWVSLEIDTRSRKVRKERFFGFVARHMPIIDGHRNIFLGNDFESDIAVLDGYSGQENELQASSAGGYAALSSNGAYLAMAGENMVGVWDASSGEKVAGSDREGVEYSCVVPTRRPTRIFVCLDGKIQLLDLKTQKLLYEIGPGVLIGDIRLTQDESRLFHYAEGGILQTYDAKDGALLAKSNATNEYYGNLTISPNDEFLVYPKTAYGVSFQLADLSGNVTSTWSAQTFLPKYMSFLGGGRYLLVDYLWADRIRQSGKEVSLVWDLATAQMVDPDDIPGADKLKASLTGVFSSSRGFWHDDVRENSEFWKFFDADSEELQRDDANLVHIMPDGISQLSGIYPDIDRLYDEFPKDSDIFQSHKAPLSGLSFDLDHPSGIVASASYNDGTVRLWNSKTGKEIALLAAFSDGSWLILTPEGFFNASDGGEKHLTVVRGQEVVPLDRLYDTLYRPDLVLEALRGDLEGKFQKQVETLNLQTVLDGGSAPEIVSPNAVGGTTTPEETVEVEFTLRPLKGGIGRVEVRTNQATQFVQDLGEPADGGERQLRVPVFLSPGKNQIEIIAYNRLNLIASSVSSIGITSTAVPQDHSALHVLSVGINEYRDSALNLHYAVNDAEKIAQALKKVGGGTFDDIKIHTVLNGDATEQNLARTFEALRHSIKPEDVFVFFASGHGKTIDGRYYFIPHDLIARNLDSIRHDGIAQETWQKWFASIPARKSVLLYDTCESGTLTNDDGARLEGEGAVQRLTRAVGRTIIAASSDAQAAQEGFGGHGLFTYSLLEALSAGDKDGDGIIEVNELVSYVEENVPEIAEEQFHTRQVPKASIQGLSFALGQPARVIDD